MATKTFYLLNTSATSPNWAGTLQDGGTAPTATTSVFGWTVAKTATTTPYWRARVGASSAATVAAASSNMAAATGPQVGTSATNTTAGDFFSTTSAYTGTFAAGNWTFTFGMRSTTVQASGRINFRVWASTSATGASARELTSGSQIGSTITLTATGTTYNSTNTWSAPAITLNNEYLFLQVEWQETTAGSVNGTNVFFYISACSFTTTDLAIPPDITSNLQAWYEFKDTSNTDSSGNANTGTAVGSPVYSTTGGPSAAEPGNVKTDGTSSYIDLGAPTNLENAISQVGGQYTVFTLCAWIKTSVTQSAAQLVVTKDYSTGNRGFCLGVNGAGYAYMELGGSPSFGNVGPLLNDGNWHHIACTFLNPGSYYLYADGVQVATTVGAGTLFSNSAAHWYIGGRQYVGYFNGINGSIADVRIYGRQLSAADINAIYTYQPPACTGTLALTEQPDTLSAAGAVTVRGTLSLTQANQTLAAAGWSTALGTLTATQANQTLSAAGGPRVSGTLALTEINDTLAAAGGPRVGGSLGATQAAQTLSANGTVSAQPITGTLSVTQAAQTLVATGGPIVTGTLSTTQAPQTLVAAGSLTVTGALSVTQAAQTLSAAGKVTVSGTLALTEAFDTLSAAGSSTVLGTLAQTQALQTLSGVGRVTVSGSLVQTEALDTLAATAATQVVGTLSITQAPQTLSGLAAVTVTGALSVNQAAQTLAASGVVGLVAGSVVVTQAAQTLSATGTVPNVIGGALALTQQANTLSATAAIPTFTELMHHLSGGGLRVAGTIRTRATVAAALPTPGRRGARNFVTDATMPLAAGVGSVVNGGGNNRVPVYDDGASWRIG